LRTKYREPSTKFRREGLQFQRTTGNDHRIFSTPTCRPRRRHRSISGLFIFFIQGATTVNFAISLHARCRIETRDDGRIVLESRDRKVSFETDLSALEDLLQEERLELISKLVHFFKPTTGFHLIAESAAPAGAGLGGSSALAIACIGALNRLVGNRYDESQFVTIAANVESTVIRVPAGFQDYYPPLYGSVSSIHFRPDGMEREALDIDINELEQRIAICYTGEPRMSGINNWEIFKRHIDGDAELFELFEGIRDSARNVREALLANDWGRVAEIMQKAYPNRRRLGTNNYDASDGYVG
jgi:D-glycero-alpha-D-manno-heptose-7-phosphate kinase